MQAATVGVAAPPGISSISSQDLAAQLGAMTQPSAQPSMGAPTSAAPSISSYGFSGMTSAGLPGIAGSPAPSTSSLATAASVAPSSTAPSQSQGVSRSASSISAEDAPQEQTGIVGLLGSTPASLVANGLLSAAFPEYGLANLGVMGLTGTSIYGQGLSLASGQGLQTGGGLMGLAGGSTPSFGGTAPAAVSGSSGGRDAGDVTPTVPSMGEEILVNVPTEPRPVQYNISTFRNREAASPPVIAAVPTFYNDYLKSMGYRL